MLETTLTVSMFRGSIHTYLVKCSSMRVLVAVSNAGVASEVVANTPFALRFELFGDSIETGFELHGMTFIDCDNMPGIFSSMTLVPRRTLTNSSSTILKVAFINQSSISTSMSIIPMRSS